MNDELEKNKKKEINWHGIKIMVGDTVIGTAENCKLVDKNNLPKVHEIKPIEWEHIPSIEFTRLAEPISKEDITSLFEHIKEEGIRMTNCVICGKEAKTCPHTSCGRKIG